MKDPELDKKAPDDPPIPEQLTKFLSKLGTESVDLSGVSCLHHVVALETGDIEVLGRRLFQRGIVSPLVLAERALAGVDVEKEASSLGIGVMETMAIHAAAVSLLSPEERAAIDEAVRHPRGKGLLPPEHPTIAPLLKAFGIDNRLVTADRVRRWIEIEGRWTFLPRGPLRAVDHRPKLGPARDQGGRPTCTSFGSTAVAEELEFLRDRRRPPRDFSEEFLWWYSKNGALITAGGYDGRVALYHYEKNGAPAESLLPYSGMQLGSNHAHVPVSDAAIDRARDHRQPPMAMLPERDVGVVKAVLESGRCVAFGSDVDNWSTATGVIGFPDPLNSLGVGGGHCTAIIGYIDRDDLPEHYEGGYFIVRNSWGGVDSPAHLMGPEYGGHLLMPYGWYRRYTGWPATLGSDADTTGTAAIRSWRAEYYENGSLRGTPSRIELVPDVDFDWGSGGPFNVKMSFGWAEVEFPVPPFDQFSARFTQVRRLRPGWHRFTLRGDDGIRLWVDDRLVINAWRSQRTTSYSAEHFVTGGDHVLRVEYFEAHGAANVELEVEAIEFHYELFKNTELTGAADAVFDDSLTDLEWRHAPPVGTAFSAGRFSLRATGSKHFAAGRYTFHAQHTGGCRIWIDDRLVLDDWSGVNGNGAPVTLTAGTHAVRVEFAHRTVIPPPDAKSYYRAALSFNWADADWRGRVHFDPARKAIADAGWPGVDHVHEAFRVQALTGNPVLDHTYSLPAPAGTSYWGDNGPAYRLVFPSNASFGAGIPGGSVIDGNTAFFSAILTRRLYVQTEGRYEVSLRSDEAFRVSIDGNKVLDRRYGGEDPFATEIYLRAGVHDVAVEYADSGWNSLLDFALKPASWQVRYYSGTDLTTHHSTKQVVGAERIIIERPAALSASNWSARASRRIWLPVGRYRVVARAKDGIRVKANGTPLVDAWKDQAATTYSAFLEHGGGAVDVELEYYQKSSGELSFDLTPDGFLGEYYRGVTLEKTAASDDWLRNPPHAYRFEPSIDFDWGATGHLPRVGADRFSARWWGTVELPVGRWRFKLTSDDGVRLFLDDRLLIDRWVEQGATSREAIVDLPFGRRELRVEYFEKTGHARCQLEIRRM